jgi:glycosyltransferase involved in cell wall biosynthesis
VICQSGEMKRLLCKNFGIPAHKIEAVRMSPRVLPEATGRYPAIEPMLNTPRGARILYVGDAHSYRMLDTAVSGMTTVRQTRDDARLFMTIGREHAFGSKPGVHPLPYLNPEELSAAYDAADALVLPSLIESCPQPPLEAMSFGVPTLLADRPYAHDIFGDAALYFNPGNPNDFAEKCLRLLGDETLRRRLIEAGRNLVNAARTSQPYTRMVDICCEEYANSRSEALQRK